MKRKLKNILAMLLAVMLIFSATPATASAAGRKPTPGKVTLTQISSPAYNKINIKWNRTSNATHYKIYYKKGRRRPVDISCHSKRQRHQLYTHIFQKQTCYPGTEIHLHSQRL